MYALLLALSAVALADNPPAIEVTEISPAGAEVDEALEGPDACGAFCERPNSLRLTLAVPVAGVVGLRYDRSLGERWSVGGAASVYPSTAHAHARFRPKVFNGVFAPAVELALGGGAFVQQLEFGEDPSVLDAAGLVAFEYRGWGGLAMDFAVSVGPAYFPRSATFIPALVGFRFGVGGSW